MEATTIDTVISKLETIINNSINTNKRAGYFAALYYKVTCRVKEGILSGEFDNGKRMEQLDVVFANRYLTAYEQWEQKKNMTASWKLAFEAVNKPYLLVIQHLFLGMNAHINLDLGIAVVEVAKLQNQPLEALHADFNKINTILSSLTYQVISELDQVSPLLSLAGLHSKNDSLFIQFAMTNARDGAWCFAEELYHQKDDQFTTCIEQRDRNIYLLGKGILQTKGLLKFTLFIIYLFSIQSPARIIRILHNYTKSYKKIN